MTPLFALHSDEASLGFEQDERDRVVWRHCGVRVEPGDLSPHADTCGPASYSLDDDVPPGIKPPAGMGWFGPPAVELRGESGEELPFIADSSVIEEADGSLTFTSCDGLTGLAHRLIITLLPGAAIRLSVSLTNDGEQTIHIDSRASAFLPVRFTDGEILSWQGRHNAELVECCEPLPQHRQERRTRRGISGHGGAPGVYFLAPDASHHCGLVLALQLAWSGDASLAVERDDEGYLHLTAAASLKAGELSLEPGETY